MTKKQREELLMKEEIINKNLLFSIGLEIDPRGYVIDQDTLDIVKCRGKNIKYNNIVHYGTDIKLEPITNRRLIVSLFELFLVKDSELNDRYYRAYYDKINKEGKSCIVVNFDDTNAETDYFYNDTLRYIDFIFKSTGVINLLGFSLHEFDDEKFRKSV